jgi:hypothetical protein
LAWAADANADEDDLAPAPLELAKFPTRVPSSVQPTTPATTSPQLAAGTPSSPFGDLPPLLRPAPIMLGDYFTGRAGNRFVTLPRTTIVSTFIIDNRTGQITEIRTPVTTNQQFRVFVPGGSRQFKIADNESPQPQDRFTVAFNYFNDYNYSLHRRLGVGDVRLDEYRATLAFEKTFGCGDGSIGLRLPLIQSASRGAGDGLTGGEMGDLSFIFKYAPWRNHETGDLIAVGLGVTAPTGSGDDNPFHGTLVQPFVGCIKNFGAWYLHGFVSVEFPVEEDDDVTLLFTDLGVGYRLWESPDCTHCLTAITPTAEVHVNTPLNHRGVLSGLDPAGTPDTVDVTIGSHFDLGQQARLTLGAVTPVTGPRPFRVELMGYLNVRF